MRRLLLVLTIVAATCGLMSVGAATASAAANCAAVYNGAIFWNGNLSFNTYIGTCTEVDKVEFGFVCCSGTSAGIVDLTQGGVPRAAGLMCCGSSVKNITGGEFAVITYGVAPWCPPQTTHTVKSRGVYRIHNAFWGGSWGSWHTVTRTESIWC